LLELASEAILVRDMEGRVQFWNSGAETLYGWRRGEVMGKDAHHVLQTVFPVPQEDIRLALEEDGRWSGNLVQRTKDGIEVTVASRQVLVVESSNIPNVILEINHDITAQLRVEEALRSAEQFAAMGRVAGTIAHEINNPLEAIINALFLLYNQPSLDEEARRYAGIANQELLRLAHIVRHTLGFYRESQHAVPVSMCTLLDQVLELQATVLRLNRISLRKDYRTRKVILGFPVELKQVLLNLTANAVQAMPDGGCLTVRVREGTEHRTQRKGIRVTVCDTGAGIKPEDTHKIFEPFFTTKAEKGTGLGLWISKGIVQKYEGTIRARTVRLSRGAVTCFSIFFPGSKDAASAQELEREMSAG
jgi:PAS domain S-box-containing protein